MMVPFAALRVTPGHPAACDATAPPAYQVAWPTLRGADMFPNRALSRGPWGRGARAGTDRGGYGSWNRRGTLDGRGAPLDHPRRRPIPPRCGSTPSPGGPAAGRRAGGGADLSQHGPERSGSERAGLSSAANLTGSRLVETELVGAKLLSGSHRRNPERGGSQPCEPRRHGVAPGQVSEGQPAGRQPVRHYRRAGGPERGPICPTPGSSATSAAAKLPGANLKNSNSGRRSGNQSMGVMRATFVSADLRGADLAGANLFKGGLLLRRP